MKKKSQKHNSFLQCRDTDTDKLRNLSVSSADFNYDPNNAGGSMPGGAFDVTITITTLTTISGIICLGQALPGLACEVAVSTFLIGHKSTLTHLLT